MDRPLRGRILVIRGGAIGDFILTLPAIAALRQRFPEAHLEVLGYPHIAQLALAGGLVDRVQSIEARALASFFARNGPWPEDMADYFSEFDLIISYLYDPDLIFQTNVQRCTSAQFIQGPHHPDETTKIHASEVFLRPLERLAIFDADPVPQLTLPLKASQSRPDFTLALHPGSGSPLKNWPESNWEQLLRWLVSHTQFDLLLVGGEAEGNLLQRLAANLHADRVRIAQSLPLAELAALLQDCVAFIGHDSGIAHLAAAVGLPGIILWGRSVAEIWRPPSQKVTLVRHAAGISGIGLEQVTPHVLAWSTLPKSQSKS